MTENTPDLIAEVREEHVPREVFFGYSIKPGEVVEQGYIETCMCKEPYPCRTVRIAGALEDEQARAESAERRIEKVVRLRDRMERQRDDIDESVRLSTILADLNAALTEGDEQ